MNIIFETIFGSHLYGTNTQNSDMDYKGIILPTKEQILLGNSKYHIEKNTGNDTSKNSNQDIDRSYYSLQYFIQLAIKGETVALDALHGNRKHWVISSNIWDFLVENRIRFYTKSMTSYLGYVRKQAAKYGIKGSRVGELERVLNYVSRFDDHDKVSQLKGIPISDLVKWVDYKGNHYLEIATSKFQENLSLVYLKKTLNQMYDFYGERSKLAKDNLGIDLKAVSHAFRVGYQLRSIYKHGTFFYPLNETPFIIDIKNGNIDYLTWELSLTELNEEITILANHSQYPEKVEIGFWNDYICDIHEQIVKGTL